MLTFLLLVVLAPVKLLLEWLGKRRAMRREQRFIESKRILRTAYHATRSAQQRRAIEAFVRTYRGEDPA